MKMNWTKGLFAAAVLCGFAGAAAAQEEGSLATQVLIRADSKLDVVPTASALELKIDGKVTPVTSLAPVKSSGVQVALLIDDGLTRQAGIQLSDLRDFVKTLPPDTELLLGYMNHGTVEVMVPFTTDHAAAAAKLRIPTGIPGESASPYFCLSDFVKHWPGAAADTDGPVDHEQQALGKARFVMMVTNGVDPYNGSTSLANQDSPYVNNSITDAQRAGVAVSSIYYRDAGIRGGAVSGQDYLSQVSNATGGEAYYQGFGNPVSLTPFFKQFDHAIAETYVATFNAAAGAGGREHLVRVQLKSDVPKLKFRHPDEVRPGNVETASTTAAGGL